MAYYDTCPICGSHLDPGEKCDCTTSEEDLGVATKRAQDKLKRIIEREGDADGERLKPYYLKRLIEEELRAARFQQNTLDEWRKKRAPRTARAVTRYSHINNSIVSRIIRKCNRRLQRNVKSNQRARYYGAVPGRAV